MNSGRLYIILFCHHQHLLIVDWKTCEQVLLQTVNTQMKWSKKQHLIRVCTVCYDFRGRNIIIFGNYNLWPLNIQVNLIISESKGMENWTSELSEVRHKQIVTSSKCNVLVQFRRILFNLSTTCFGSTDVHVVKLFLLKKWLEINLTKEKPVGFILGFYFHFK